MNVASEDDVLLMATKAFMHGHKVATLMVMLELVSLMGHHGRSIQRDPTSNVRCLHKVALHHATAGE